MSSFAASLLDELMGRNRNANMDEEHKDLNWEDPEVCKFHLCGFCPHELFTNTRADLGPCYKIHDEELARNYKLSTRHGRMGYENEFLDYLETLITDVDRRIKRGQARLALSAQHQAQQEEELSAAQNTRMALITEKINKMLEETEKLGCEGKVDEAQELMAQTEKLKEEKRILEEIKNRQAEPPAPNDNSNASKEMEVCTICGAFLVVGDAIQRIEEHLQGKQHLGYMKIRDKIDDIRNGMRGMDSERENRLAREREEREKEKAAERERQRAKEERGSSRGDRVSSSRDKGDRRGRGDEGGRVSSRGGRDDEGGRERDGRKKRSRSRSSRDRHASRHAPSSKRRSRSRSSERKSRKHGTREGEEREEEGGDHHTTSSSSSSSSRRKRREERHEGRRYES